MSENKTSKAAAQSITSRLSNLAREQKKPYDKLLTIFILERAVTRLTQDEKLARHLIFKGGYVSLRVYDSPRFTKDVDAVLKGLGKSEAVAKIKGQMENAYNDGVWFEFDNEQVLTTQSEYGGIRLSYRCGLSDRPKSTKKSQVIQIDIGTGDPVTPQPSKVETPSLLGRGSLTWQVYPVETIVAEKLHTILVRGAANSRARDIYDVDLLLPRIETSKLTAALRATFEHRGSQLPTRLATAIGDIETSILKRGWTGAVGYIEGSDGFDKTFSRLIDGLEKLGV